VKIGASLQLVITRVWIVDSSCQFEQPG